jgi:small nuclear ribonucleoprotein
MQRPLDVLGSSEDKRIIIRLKSGEEITGILKAFDSHINVWLDESEIKNSEKEVKLGRVLVRGDNIIFVSPAQ